MIKIVRGNDVKLTFPFFEKPENGYITPLDMSEVTDLAVKFIRSNGEEIAVESGISVQDNNVVVIIPCYTEIGRYHVSISGMIGNAHVCSTLKDCFSIVQFNCDGNFTDVRTTYDNIIDESVLLRVDVDEHDVPSDDTDDGTVINDEDDTTPSDNTGDGEDTSTNENTER